MVIPYSCLYCIIKNRIEATENQFYVFFLSLFLGGINIRKYKTPYSASDWLKYFYYFITYDIKWFSMHIKISSDFFCIIFTGGEDFINDLPLFTFPLEDFFFLLIVIFRNTTHIKRINNRCLT